MAFYGKRRRRVKNQVNKIFKRFFLFEGSINFFLGREKERAEWTSVSRTMRKLTRRAVSYF